MDDITIEFMTEGESQTRYDLRAEFYRRNRFREYFWDGTSKLSAARPIAIVQKELDTGDSMQIVYSGGYYVIIERGKSLLSGPHSVKLYMYHKDYPDGIWLGTTQFDGSFYDEKRIKKQLRETIKGREFWMSDASEDEEITLEEPKEIVDMEHHEVKQLPLRKENHKFRVYFVPLKHANRIPRCPKCLCEKPKWRNIQSHYFKKHGKKLFVFHPKPLDKCPPM